MANPLFPSRCSFCDKKKSKKRRIIAGRNRVFVCEACVNTFAKMLDSRVPRTNAYVLA
jgi:ATP-dependent protease Clp ATPase subunit